MKKIKFQHQTVSWENKYRIFAMLLQVETCQFRRL